MPAGPFFCSGHGIVRQVLVAQVGINVTVLEPGQTGPLPRRVEPGGVPRPFRGVRAARRGRGATPAALGLLPLFPVDRARLRGRGRGALCDPDGRFAFGRGSELPGVGAGSALRRERGGGDLRLEAGVREGRAVPARAAAELGSSALGIDFFRRYSRTRRSWSNRRETKRPAAMSTTSSASASAM